MTEPSSSHPSYLKLWHHLWFIIPSSHQISNPINSASLLAIISASTSSFLQLLISCSSYEVSSQQAYELPKRPRAWYSRLLSIAGHSFQIHSWRYWWTLLYSNAFQSKTRILDYQRPSMNWVQPILPNLFSCNLSGLKYQTEFSSSCLVVSCISNLIAYAYHVLLTLKALFYFCVSSLPVLQGTSFVAYFICDLLQEGFNDWGIIFWIITIC